MPHYNLSLGRFWWANRSGHFGCGFCAFLTVALVLEVWMEFRFVFKERAGLVLVRFVFFRLTGLGVGRLGGLTETPLVITCQILVRGSRRKPSP
jgi:hypothetical protein